MFDLTIIIPTYNRQAQLQRVLAALSTQSYPLANIEVIVISDGSTDGTLDYLRHVQQPFKLQAIAQENQGAAAARNRGIQAAKGKLILFIDDDVVPTSTLIAEHLRSHKTAQSESVVLGPMLTPADFTMTPWVQWEQTMLIKQYDEMIAELWQPTARQFYTGNASVARHHLLAVGGFDPTFRRAEDIELAYRLAGQGLTFLFNPNAIGYHYAERSFASWMHTPYAYGQNDVTFAQKQGQIWVLAAAAQEFVTRHWLIGLVVLTCLSRPRLALGMIQTLQGLAMLATRCGVQQMASYAYSGLFNLQYYQGMADALGGRQLFLKLLEQESTVKPFFRSLLSGRSSARSAN